VFAVAPADLLGPTIEVDALPEQFESVRAVVAGGLVAFVSTYRGPVIEEVPQSELTGRLLLHQQVIEQLMRTSNVLPVRLGTILEDDEAVAWLLRGSGELLRSTWEKFRDTVEIDIAATWDIGEILAQIAGDPDVEAAKSAALAASTEQRPEAAIGVGQLVEAKLHERRGELERKILEQLQPCASDMQLNAVVSDELVCNIALLVDQSRAADIDATLHRLDAELDGRYNFRRVGPLPPYSFATVHVHRIGPDEIERSLAVLELSGSFDESAVQDQYRVLALTRHPDVRTTDPSAARDFEDLTGARTTLMSVCRNRPDTSCISDSAIFHASIERSIGRNWDV